VIFIISIETRASGEFLLVLRTIPRTFVASVSTIHAKISSISERVTAKRRDFLFPLLYVKNSDDSQFARGNGRLRRVVTFYNKSRALTADTTFLLAEMTKTLVS